MTKGRATRTRHIQRARKCGKLTLGKTVPTHTHAWHIYINIYTNARKRGLQVRGVDVVR